MLIYLPGLDCYSFPLTLSQSMVILRDTPGNLLYFTHTLFFYFSCRGVVSLVIRIIHPSQYHNSFFCFLIQSHENLKVGGWSLLPLQWNHCCVSCWKCSSLWNYISRPVEYKVAGTGSKHFATGSLGITWMMQLPFPPFHSCTCESWLSEKSLYSWHWFRAYITS